MASEKKSSTDPAVLAAQLESTRDDLAATLDEIVDRVSPKRAVGRAKAKVVQAVKGGSPSAAPAVPVAGGAPTASVLPSAAPTAVRGPLDLSAPPAAPAGTDQEGGIPREYLLGGAAAVTALLLWRRHRRNARRLPTRAEVKAALKGDPKARRTVVDALDRAGRHAAHEAAVSGREALGHARGAVEDAAHEIAVQTGPTRRKARKQAARAGKKAHRAAEQAREAAAEAAAQAQQQARRSAKKAGKHARRLHA